MKDCIKCKDAFEGFELNLTDQGPVCDGCLEAAPSDESQQIRPDIGLVALDRAKSMLVAGAVAAGLGTLLSMRSTTTEGVILEGGERFQKVNVSADLPGLVGCGAAMVFLAYGLYLVLVVQTHDQATQQQRLKLGLGQLAVAIWAVYRLVGSLPYVSH